MLQPKLLKVEPTNDYQLILYYETGEVKIFDVKPYINGDWYKELDNEAYFKTVHLICNGAGIEWLHGQDIAPHELYKLSKPYGEFDDQIFKELLSEGLEGEALFSAYKQKKSEIKSAIEIAKIGSKDKSKYYFYEEIFET